MDQEIVNEIKDIISDASTEFREILQLTYNNSNLPKLL